MVASTRGTTRRASGETPSTSMASISSRILREPRSAQIAEPPAPAMSSAVTMGLASRTTPRTATAPVKLCAPICLVRLPTCSARTAPNGIETSAVGRIVTLAMNQACCTNAAPWNGRLNRLRTTSSASAKKSPAPRTGAAGANAIRLPSGAAPQGTARRGLLGRALGRALGGRLTQYPPARRRAVGRARLGAVPVCLADLLGRDDLDVGGERAVVAGPALGSRYP